jgi:transcriptional regulator with XRE-family HTH domain
MRPDTVNSAALLREARLRGGLSQEGLADRTGRSRPQIARWEAGGNAPSLDTLLELIRACGYDLPLELSQLQPMADDHLTELQQLSPERRVDRMLGQLATKGRR